MTDIITLNGSLAISPRAGQLVPGLYLVQWKDGGASWAAVGQMHDDRMWFAPVNWLGTEIPPIGAEVSPVSVASCDWQRVAGVWTMQAAMSAMAGAKPVFSR